MRCGGGCGDNGGVSGGGGNRDDAENDNDEDDVELAFGGTMLFVAIHVLVFAVAIIVLNLEIGMTVIPLSVIGVW